MMKNILEIGLMEKSMVMVLITILMEEFTVEIG
jgi:hypothetical protein